MLTEFAKYWKRNIILGFQRAGKWMGFWGKIVDVIIAMSAGKIYGQDNIILFGIITVVVAFSLYGLSGFIFTLFIVPYQEHKNLQEIVDSYPPGILNIFVGISPMRGWVRDGHNDIQTVYLKIISLEKKKIFEFHASRVIFLQRTADMKPDLRGAEFGTVINNVRFEWDDGKEFSTLLPDSTKEILIAELDIEKGYPTFGKAKLLPPEGKKPSIYEIVIRFKGKLDGEHEFAYYDYRTELYCHPENQTLDFTERARDIPDELKAKVFFADKNQ